MIPDANQITMPTTDAALPKRINATGGRHFMNAAIMNVDTTAIINSHPVTFTRVAMRYDNAHSKAPKAARASNTQRITPDDRFKPVLRIQDRYQSRCP